jgi:hypothetical protein
MAKQSVLGVLFVLALVACGGSRRSTEVDSGTGGTDTGVTPPSDSGGPRDTGSTARDTGGGGSDPCAVAMPPSISTVGCNGGFQTGMGAANAAFGTCTPDATMMNAAGTCTNTTDLCIAPMDGTVGYCSPVCDPGDQYTSTSTCPDGSRCFPTMGGGGVCFRDCDASHACPMGGACDTDGSCPLAMGG